MKIIWNHLKSSEITWNHLKSPEITWNHLKSPEITWNHLKSSEIIWNHLKSPEITWNHLKSLEITWNHLKSRNHEISLFPLDKNRFSFSVNKYEENEVHCAWSDIQDRTKASLTLSIPTFSCVQSSSIISIFMFRIFVRLRFSISMQTIHSKELIKSHNVLDCFDNIL